MRMGRQAAGLTQRELAERVGISQTTVSRLEAGQRIASLSPEAIEAISKEVNTPIMELIAGSPMGYLADQRPLTEFRAYCPNLACLSNQELSKAGTGTWTHIMDCPYPPSMWEQIEYCIQCRHRLVKQCPKCGQPIISAEYLFCARCGRKLRDEVTEETIAKWRKRYPQLPAVTRVSP
jgi:DNA-binding XRE family transcriptional regulator